MRGHTIKLAALGAVAFMVLDGVWLGVLMKNFYREQLAPIVRLACGGLRRPVRARGVRRLRLTNYSTLRQWPFVLTLADVASEVAASAVAAVAVRSVVR